MKSQITRLWSGVTRAEEAGAYQDYLFQTGLRDYAATPGNRGAVLLRRTEGDKEHFLILSMWDSTDSIRAFAGENIDEARFYPEDERFLLEKDLRVSHYQTIPVAGELNRLIGAFRNNYEGQPWYGEPIARILEGVTFEMALARPLRGVHSIFEIVAHSLHWRRFGLTQLRNQAVEPADDTPDWISWDVKEPSDWEQLKADFAATQQELLEAMQKLDDRLLDEKSPSRTYSIRFLLQGLIQHDCYHFGQVSLLKRATLSA